MSNAVDILVVDGPRVGLVLCQPRPVPTSIVHEDVTYTTGIHNQVYRIAYLLTPAGAAGVIADTGFQPSWDLRAP